MASRYRFLFSLRWVGLCLLAVALIASCIFLGTWQYGRYSDRAATNVRIAEAGSMEPSDATSLMSVEKAPAGDAEWQVVKASGVYDRDSEVLVRNRSVGGQTGFEVITPLVLNDGVTLLVDRGFVPASKQGAMTLPDVPEAPTGEVTVTGRLRVSESEVGKMNSVDGVLQARSIAVQQIGEKIDATVLAGYVTQEDADTGLTPIPVEKERAWQNFAYAYQWWIFAGMIPIGFVVLARREAKTSAAAA